MSSLTGRSPPWPYSRHPAGTGGSSRRCDSTARTSSRLSGPRSRPDVESEAPARSVTCATNSVPPPQQARGGREHLPADTQADAPRPSRGTPAHRGHRKPVPHPRRGAPGAAHVAVPFRERVAQPERALPGAESGGPRRLSPRRHLQPDDRPASGPDRPPARRPGHPGHDRGQRPAAHPLARPRRRRPQDHRRPPPWRPRPEIPRRMTPRGLGCRHVRKHVSEREGLEPPWL